MFKKLKTVKASKVLLILFLGMFVLLQSGCTQGFNFKMEYDKGVRAYNEKDYESAVVSLTNALNFNPRSYSTYCLLGTSYAYKGDDKNAERVLTEGVNAFPDLWNAYVFLGDLKRSQKNYSSAINFYEQASNLKSMPDKEKEYYKKLISEVKKEDFKKNSENAEPQGERMAKILLEKQNAKQNKLSSNTDSTSSAVPTAQGSEPINLDWTKWQNSYTVNNGNNSTVEYGLKGEDVKNFLWSELVTIQHFANDPLKPFNANDYLSGHLKPIEELAKNTQKTFNKETISQTPTEIIYQWTFDGGKESEIARVLVTDKGLYHYHYAKKGSISAEQKTKWLKVLKSAKVTE